MAKREKVVDLPVPVRGIKELLKDLRKKHGDFSALQVGDRPKVALDVVPSGSWTLDLALGVGGYPRGRIVETYGAASGGKTTLALHAMAEAQKAGGSVAFVDAENSYDPFYARTIGVQDDAVLVQPDSGEQALGITAELVESGHFTMVVVDSVAALVPQAELDGEIGDSFIGLQARMMGQALRRLCAITAKTNTLLLFLNQQRKGIGPYAGNTTPGGLALGYYASVRINVHRGEQLKQGDAIVGCTHTAKVLKNKVSMPFREATFDVLFGTGIDRYGTLLDMAIEQKVIEQKGAWYAVDGQSVCQGRFKLRDMLETDIGLRDKCISAITKLHPELKWT